MAALSNYPEWAHTTYLPASASDLPLGPAPPQRTARRGKSPGHIPRPRNAFIIFRSKMGPTIPQSVTKDQKRVSRSMGELWRNLSPTERAVYQKLADDEKANHMRLYPDYVFHPTKRAVAPRKRKVKGSTSEDKARDREVAKLIREGKQGAALARSVRARDEGVTEDTFELDVEAPVALQPAPVVPDPFAPCSSDPSASAVRPWIQSSFEADPYYPYAPFMPTDPAPVVYDNDYQSVGLNVNLNFLPVPDAPSPFDYSTSRAPTEISYPYPTYYK
ncbi:Transcription factor [Mycena kentingensis (nom. inval.)]|nr:Transcription factor [Mycena kentingensis (nom. inval.)]